MVGQHASPHDAPGMHRARGAHRAGEWQHAHLDPAMQRVLHGDVARELEPVPPLQRLVYASGRGIGRRIGCRAPDVLEGDDGELRRVDPNRQRLDSLAHGWRDRTHDDDERLAQQTTVAQICVRRLVQHIICCGAAQLPCFDRLVEL